GNTTTPFPSSFGNPLNLTINGVVTTNLLANLNTTGTTTINTGGSLTLNGDFNFNVSNTLLIAEGAIFDNGGNSQITGSGAITINGRFITRDADGFVGTNTSITLTSRSLPTLGNNSIIEYAATGNQTVQGSTAPIYSNLTISGGGIKTLASNNAMTIGTITVNGSVTFDVGNNTLGGIGTNLTMTGASIYRTAGTGTKPDAQGTYSLASSSTIEFYNNSVTKQNIRLESGSYYNITVSGSSVQNASTSNTPINLQSGGTFTVTSSGVFTQYNANGLNCSTCAINTNVTPVLQVGATIEYARDGTTQTITPRTDYTNVIISGTSEKTAASSFTIANAGTFTRTGSASMSAGSSSPVYSANATLAYVSITNSRTYTAGLEWPSSSQPTNVTINLSGTGSPTVTIGSSMDRNISGTLNLQAGTLSLGNNTLTLSGSLTGTGLFRGGPTSSITVNGSFTSGTFNFDQTTPNGKNIASLTNLLKDFSIAGGTISLGNSLNLANGVFSITGGTFVLGNNDVTLKSDNNATTMAQVGTLTGTINYNGSGRFITERAMTTLRRGFRSISSGGIISDADIWTNWQEGATTANPNPNPGYGTHITGGNFKGTTTAVSTTLGFDATRTGNPSLWTYGLANTYIPLQQTIGTILYPWVGYYTVVRGDRSYDIFTSSPDLQQALTTTLRTKGRLLRGNVSLTTTSTTYVDPSTGNTRTDGQSTLNVGSNRFSLVGNPYASAIDFHSVHASSTNI
ncbi:MAG: beta strand repeat-containing protein, partial [Chitinophagaceae bacterium]